MRGIAKNAGARSLLVNVVAYGNHCEMETHTVKDSSGRTISTVETGRQRCGDITFSTIRELLFTEEGVLMWRDKATESDTAPAVERAANRMFAAIPAESFTSGDHGPLPPPAVAEAAPPSAAAALAIAPPVAAPPTAAAPAPVEPAPAPVETPATILASLGESTTPSCVRYAKAACDKGSLDQCRSAVATVSAKPAGAKCKVPGAKKPKTVASATKS